MIQNRIQSNRYRRRKWHDVYSRITGLHAVICSGHWSWTEMFFFYTDTDVYSVNFTSLMLMMSKKICRQQYGESTDIVMSITSNAIYQWSHAVKDISILTSFTLTKNLLCWTLHRKTTATHIEKNRESIYNNEDVVHMFFFVEFSQFLRIHNSIDGWTYDMR